ncbi:hypothetical protein [Microcystis viridis]|uniref:Uncharacterized protein n=1 Tax=Microcystis viridis FACHB-1342 TaxID=2692900 RepID=A0ABR8GIN1_MICVR|nr:hypothetical protein [Microcystis viridis]MBD2602578.1 hypothetical protein [Microcystis viridis FACHB-1342]
MGNFGQIPPAFFPPPPPRFLSNIAFLSPEDGFLKETRFLSAIAWGRSGLGYL